MSVRVAWYNGTATIHEETCMTVIAAQHLALGKWDGYRSRFGAKGVRVWDDRTTYFEMIRQGDQT